MRIKTSVILKAFLLIFFFVAVCHSSFSQYGKVIDSLINLTKTEPEDTNKVQRFINISFRLVQKYEYVGSQKYADEAFVLAEKLDFKRGKATVYNVRGMINRSQSNYPDALQNFFTSIRIYKETGYGALYDPYYNLGVTYYNMSNYPEALKYYKEAMRMRGPKKDQWSAQTYTTIGLVYHELGNYSEALKNHLICLNISEEIGYKLGIAQAYSNIGEINTRLGKYSEALKNYYAALNIAEEVGNKYGIAVCKTAIGIVYLNQYNYQEALANHLAAQKAWVAVGDKTGTGDSYNHIGNVLRKQGNYPMALENYQASLKICEETGYKVGIARANNNIGNLYVVLNKHAEARPYILKGLSVSQEIGSKESIKEAYDYLSKLDSATGNFQQALVHYKQFAQVKDSILNETSSRQITQMKEQYESEKKDREILQLSGDKQKLESEKQITALFIKSKEDSLRFVQSEKEKIRLEKERTDALNLYNQQQLTLMAKERRLQELQIEKNEADLLVQKAETEKKQSDYLVQKAEADKKQEQLTVLNKEKAIQTLEVKKQKQAKNYFIAGLGLFAVLSIFAYRNYRTRQKLKLQTLRNKIASDLHDDVGSTLSSISIFSQMAQEQSKETIPLLETIGESSRKMLDAMADIVWTIKPENDQFEKIILRMRSFAYELLGAKNIDFEFVADEEVEKMKLPMEVRKNLYLIFKEATNNIVKYSDANRAMFAIKKEKNNLTMMIRDNGKGFDTGHIKEGNGLVNMKKRAEEIGAEFMIDSVQGSGTTIQLKVAV